MKYSGLYPPPPWVVPDNLKFVPEPWDAYPRNGFIEDVVLYQKGYETTNFFSMWAAIHYISSMVMRASWLKWAHGGLYPNFYTILVAPPGTVKKSTTIHGLEKVERQAKDLFTNPIMKFKKAGVIVRGKATPEAIFASMANENVKLEIGKDEHGQAIFDEVVKDANLIIRVSELSTFLSQAKYNVALVDKLTDFYDCKESDSDTTVNRGNIELTNIFCTMIGATTPDTLATTIPREAFGGGFISRSLILREDYTERIFAEPVAYPTLPNTEELAERLAWIGQYKQGEYVLTPEAYDFYAIWYRKIKLKLREDVLTGSTEHENNRKDIHVLKLAHIFALQRYEVTNWINLGDVTKAIEIIDYTVARSHETLRQTSSSSDAQNVDKVKQVIGRLREVRRKDLISRMSPKGINASTLSVILDELVQSDIISIFTAEGKSINTPTRSKDELYKWNSSKK